MMLYLSWTLKATLAVSVLPYIPFDIAKIVISILVVLMLPKKLTETSQKD
jgi:biotin transporter BioY